MFFLSLSLDFLNLPELAVSFPPDSGLTSSFWEALLKCLVIFTNRGFISCWRTWGHSVSPPGWWKPWSQGWGVVLCSGHSPSLFHPAPQPFTVSSSTAIPVSSSTTVDPDRSRPGAVSPGNKALMPWWCWDGEGGRLDGTSRGGSGSSLSCSQPSWLTPSLPSGVGASSPVPGRPVGTPPPHPAIPGFTTFYPSCLLLSNYAALPVLPHTFFL